MKARKSQQCFIYIEAYSGVVLIGVRLGFRIRCAMEWHEARGPPLKNFVEATAITETSQPGQMEGCAPFLSFVMSRSTSAAFLVALLGVFRTNGHRVVGC